MWCLCSTDELSLLMEHVQLLMEQRSRKESVKQSSYAPAQSSYGLSGSGNAITTKPIGIHSSRQNIPSPFKSLDLNNAIIIGEQQANASGGSSGQLSIQVAPTSASKSKPYVHNAGNYQAASPEKLDALLADSFGTPARGLTPPLTSSASNESTPTAGLYVMASAAAAAAAPTSFTSTTVAAIATSTTLLSSLSQDPAVARSQLRRSLSGDATHSIRGSKDKGMHPLATGYHTMNPYPASNGTSTGSKSKNNTGTNTGSSESSALQPDDEEELGTAFGKRTTPTKMAFTER
jgi:hypothetical protein